MAAKKTPERASYIAFGFCFVSGLVIGKLVGGESAYYFAMGGFIVGIIAGAWAWSHQEDSDTSIWQAERRGADEMAFYGRLLTEAERKERDTTLAHYRAILTLPPAERDSELASIRSEATAEGSYWAHLYRKWAIDLEDIAPSFSPDQEQDS